MSNQTWPGFFGPPIACLVATFVLVSFLSVGVGMAGPAATTHSGVMPAYSAPNGGETTICSFAETNGSLNQTYLGVYNSLPPGNGEANKSGKNAYPNVSVGEQWLLDAWIGICGTTGFVSEYTDPQPHTLTSRVQLNNTTGHFEAWYTLLFDAACGNPADNSTGSCEFFTNWYVDLTNGLVFGPVTSAGTPLSVVSNGTNGGSGPNRTTGSHPANLESSYPLEYAAAAAAIAAAAILGVALQRRRGGSHLGPEGDSGTEGTLTDSAHSGEDPSESGAASEGTPRSDPLEDVY